VTCPELGGPRLRGHRMAAQASAVGLLVVGLFEFLELAEGSRSR
jgi:hypothetical protein